MVKVTEVVFNVPLVLSRISDAKFGITVMYAANLLPPIVAFAFQNRLSNGFSGNLNVEIEQECILLGVTFPWFKLCSN